MYNHQYGGFRLRRILFNVYKREGNKTQVKVYSYKKKTKKELFVSCHNIDTTTNSFEKVLSVIQTNRSAINRIKHADSVK